MGWGLDRGRLLGRHKLLLDSGIKSRNDKREIVLTRCQIPNLSFRDLIPESRAGLAKSWGLA